MQIIPVTDKSFAPYGRIVEGYDVKGILKALEEGPDAYENVCGKLHADWAAAMRKHTGIPDVDRRFFGGAGRL